MAYAAEIEFALDWIILILSLAVFFIFYINLGKFAGGEAKRIFAFLTIFLGIFFLSVLAKEGMDIAHFLKLHKGPISGEMEEFAKITAHIMQIIGLGVIFYASVVFANFTKKLEKERKA